MTELIKKIPKINKTGFKLSFAYFLNWFVMQVIRWQCLFMITVSSSFVFTRYITKYNQDFLALVLATWVIAQPIFLFGKNKYKAFTLFIQRIILAQIFITGTTVNITKIELIRHFELVLVSALIFYVYRRLQPKMFGYFIFKYVIKKEYLGIRKTKEPLPPENNIFVDANEQNPENRMAKINQGVIKNPFQDVVEVSFLNRERQTELSCFKNFGTSLKGEFVDMDEIYYLVFTVYPFGRKYPNHFTLIKIRTSKKEAFALAIPPHGDSYNTVIKEAGQNQ